MKLTSVFAAIAVIIAFASPAWAAEGHGHGRWQAPIFWDEGNGNHWRGLDVAIHFSSGSAPEGQADPRNTVTPLGGNGQQAVVCSNRPSSWANPLPHSNWISLQADCTTGLSATDYTYSTTFTLPTNRPELSIFGAVLADDSVTVQLNGNTILNSTGGYTQPTMFFSGNASYFTTGTNTLTFIVHNLGGPSGLDYIVGVGTGRGNVHGHHGNSDNDGD